MIVQALFFLHYSLRCPYSNKGKTLTSGQIIDLFRRRMNMIRIFLVSFVMILLVVPVYAVELSNQLDTTLQDLNSSFINAHAAARKLDLATDEPIILFRNGLLVLIHNNTETTTNVILPAYNTFKVFAHIPVAIYLMLDPLGTGKFDFERFQQLRSYYKKMEYVEKNIDQIILKDTDLERQKIIISESKKFLRTVIEQQKFSTKELYLFTRRMLPFIRENIAGAAKSQLDAMHRQVMSWKMEIAPRQWEKLRVATQGAVLARNGDLAKQYFKRLLHIEKEGMRLVYKELYFTPTPMLTLLSTRSVDQGISVAIFNNPDRMFRDVLANAAAAYINQMKFD
jgi:hypothetical protein